MNTLLYLSGQRGDDRRIILVTGYGREEEWVVIGSVKCPLTLDKVLVLNKQTANFDIFSTYKRICLCSHRVPDCSKMF